MKKKILGVLCLTTMLASCDNTTIKDFSMNHALKDIAHIQGQKENGDYLYVTAGNMLYSIGNQYGDFPEVGFHVPGEMGGIWQHPIKLVDGFKLKITDNSANANLILDQCSQFTAYPFANQFRYDYSGQGLSITRTDFVPDSLSVMIVEYRIQNTGKEDKTLGLTLQVNTDLSPVWLGERSGMTDGKDAVLETKQNTTIVKDEASNWYVGIGSETDSLHIANSSDSPLQGKGISLDMTLPQVAIAAASDMVVRYYIGGSTSGVDEVYANLANAKDNVQAHFAKKKLRYDEIDRRAEIIVPDARLTEAYKWGKYNTDWLVRDVPGMGQGINAGLPDYPWFFSNDQASTFHALVGTIEPQLFYNSWEMLLKISNEYNKNSGRIIHEVSTNGQVYDKGRMEESQGFVNAAWDIYRWTGNTEFLKTYYEHGKLVWKFLQRHDANNNLFVEGYGGVEIQGLNDEMIDVAASTQAFLDIMSQMANVFIETAEAKEYADNAATLKRKINEEWWSESEQRYFDFKSDKKKAVELIDMALKERVYDDRNMWAKKKLTTLRTNILSGKHKENGYIVFYNPPMSVLNAGVADKDKAEKVLDGMSFFTNKYGMYVSGVARPDDITLEEGSVAHRLNGEFNYHEAIMAIATSSLAISECKYRGSDYAMKYIEQVLNNFSFATPGSTYEVSPDYGMFVQAWNVSGYNIPLIQYMFGVSPMASKKEVKVKPDMPSAWEYASLKRLLVGDNNLSIDFKRKGDVKTYTIDSDKEGWTILFECPTGTKSVKVNGKAVDVANELTLTGKKNIVEFN